MPTVSAIIPTYNRLPSLRIAVESVLSQRYAVHELIVVDDGSTDGTHEWCERQERITLITQHNQGVSHARNRAIEQATGEWIGLLDSDDRWYPEKLEEQVAAINQSPHYRLCHCDEHWIRNGKRVNPKFKHRKYGGDVFAHCLPLCAISPSAALLHHSLLNEVGLFDETLPACEDYDLWLRIAAREEVLYVDKALLEKTGGHADQLSQRYPAMDTFRLKALAKLLRNNNLSAEQRTLTNDMFFKKLRIYCNGAKKRGKLDSIDSMLDDYQDLVDRKTVLTFR
ncbi:MAG: glycosyltransferase family 2 protein [Granulosicoccus sp.]